MNEPRSCLQCGTPFMPRRVHQKYCSDVCRLLHHRAHPSSDGTAATVKSVRVLKSGRVSAVVHFAPDERERALRMTPGQAVSVVGCS